MPTLDSPSTQAVVLWFVLGFVAGVATAPLIWPALQKLASRAGLHVSTAWDDGTWDYGIGIDEAVAMVRNQLGSDRVESIRGMYPKLPYDLSGRDVSRLLNGLLGSSRVDAISILAPKIRRPLSEEDAELILDGLLGSNRTEAIKILSQ